MLIFLQRLASTTEIIRIDEIDIKSNTSPAARFVEIKGDLELRTYTYLPGKAEALVKQLAANSEIGSVPSTSGVAPAGIKGGDSSAPMIKLKAPLSPASPAGISNSKEVKP